MLNTSLLAVIIAIEADISKGDVLSSGGQKRFLSLFIRKG